MTSRLFRLLAATASAALATVLVLTLLPTSASSAPTTIRLGVSSPHVAGTTVASRVSTLEAELGQGQFGALRLYHAWDEWFPQHSEQFLADPARDTLPVLSVGTERMNGERVWWKDIAQAQPGSRLHNEMARWADDVRNFGRPMIITLNHEPDFYRNGGTGSPYWYKLAFQKFTWILRNRGASNARTSFVGVAWNFDPRSSTQADDYYPGDAWVDVLSVDGYNWGACRSANGPWRSMQDIFQPFLTWTEAHPGKPIMLAEFGVAEDHANPGRKRDWIRAAKDEFKKPAWNRLEIVTWWDNIHTPDTGCDFRIKSSTGSRNAFAEMLADPAFN